MTHKTMKSNGKHTNRAQIERRDHQGMSREQAFLMLPKEILTRVTAVKGTG
jgi:hypothetical protein